MNAPADRVRRTTTGDLRPNDHAARLFRARRTVAGFIPGRTDDLACGGPEKTAGITGGYQNRRLIWRIPGELIARVLGWNSTPRARRFVNAG